MHETTLLAVNCQQDASYGNRRVLDRLYRGRFPHRLYAVGGTCAVDPDYPTVVTDWTPSLQAACACCMDQRHPAGRHNGHPRLAAVARHAEAAGHAFVAWAEDDCLLGPGLSAATIPGRMAGLDALTMGAPWPVPRDDRSWVWTRHPAGYPALDASGFGGGMVATLMDCAVFRVAALARMAPDLLRLAEVWHEAAVATALARHSPPGQVGTLDGVALWGTDRGRPLAELAALLAERDFVHPIKLRGLGPAELRDLAAAWGAGRSSVGW